MSRLAWYSGACVVLGVACHSDVTYVGATGVGGASHASNSAVHGSHATLAASAVAEAASSSSTGCQTPAILCQGQCIDGASDASNCGGCFENCAEGEHCVASACVPFTCVDYLEAEDATRVKRSAGWSQAFGKIAHGGSELEGQGALSFAFEGTGLVVYYARGPNAGDFSVSVDGQPAQAVHAHLDLGFQFRTPAVIVTGLAPGEHAVQLQCPASYCYIDFFGLICE